MPNSKRAKGFSSLIEHRTSGVPPTIRVVTNALRVLEAFAEDEAIGVSALTRRVALPKSNVQRILLTLEASGWVTALDSSPKRWAPSIKVLSLASRLFKGGALRQFALPLMHDLRDRTREEVTLVVRHANRVVYLDRVESSLAVQTVSKVGSLIPIHASSGGKAMLSTLARAEIEQIIPQRLERFTPSTLCSRAALLADLERARKSGYAVSRQERRAEVYGVAAAIKNMEGVGIGAISLSIPRTRVTEKRLRELGPIVAATASSIGALLAPR